MITQQSLKRIFFPKPTVFLASTYFECEEERRYIRFRLADDYRVIMMEADAVQTPARVHPSFDDEKMIFEWIQDKIRNCEVVLVLVGKGSGSHFFGGGMPYTQFEIDAALKLHKRMVVYRLHKPFPDAHLLRPWTLTPRVHEILIRNSELNEKRLSVLDKPLKVPHAVDIHSAAEMLVRLKIDLGTQGVTVQTSRLFAYVIVGWFAFAIIVFILFRLFVCVNC